VHAPDVRSIREAAQISQSQFAKPIGVNLRTLQNWEQHRTQLTGPARALLKIVLESLAIPFASATALGGA
jgi:putative transcriptional regulator